MTTPNEAAEAIYQRVLSEFTSHAYHFENEKFTQPTGVPWVRFAIRTQNRAQETMGGTGKRRFQSDAQLMAQIFTPIDEGRQAGDTIGHSIIGIFEAVSFSDLDFKNGIVRESGVDRGWNMHIATVNFSYYETK